MTPFDGRDILAAIFLYEDRRLHIDEIVDLILQAGEAGLTTLLRKARGWKNQRGSIQSVLSKNDQLFLKEGDADYDICSSSLDDHSDEINIAFEEYKRFRERIRDKQSAAKTMAELKSELKAAKEQIHQLKRKLAQIREIAVT